MRPLAAWIAAAVLLAGCAAGTSNGFSATPPGGWEDRTDVAETRTGSEFEVVYEGTAVDGVLPTITVSRVETAASLDEAVARARVAVDRRFEGADPTRPAPARLDGERALRFDYRAGDKLSRALTARRGGHVYAVTVQTAPAGFDRGVAVFDAYLRSWRWDG